MGSLNGRNHYAMQRLHWGDAEPRLNGRTQALWRGVFGNTDNWIDDSADRALRVVEFEGLDVRLVSFRADHPSFVRAAGRWAKGPG